MEPAGAKIWAGAQQLLQALLSEEIYKLWFAPIRVSESTADKIILEVENDFWKMWLADNYMGLLKDSLGHAASKPMEVEFRVSSRDGNPAAVPAVAQVRLEVGEVTETASDLPSPTHRDALFNPKNTFETFVVGDNSSFAHAAALAVAQAPGKSYNPLFLYGGVGLGKTHLLHAIGQHAMSLRKNLKVAYVSSEKFTNEYIDAIQNNQLAKFRRRYRQPDLLLIDDIQFLAGKERIQEEFFHTFNTLHESHKQIVLTCDCPVGELKNLEHRLVSRFEWGLVTDLQPPDIETRTAILRKKERAMGVTLPEGVISLISSRVRANVRRLEGALIRVATFAVLSGKPMTVEIAEDLLRGVLSEDGRVTMTIDVIQKKVAEHYDIRMADMTGKRRPENIAFPRQIAMYLSRRLTDRSLHAIGDAFGGRDHGTVMHACRKVQDRMEVSPEVRKAVQQLERALMR